VNGPQATNTAALEQLTHGRNIGVARHDWLQVVAEATAALSRGRNCLVLTNWTAHLDKLADAL